MKNEIKIWQRIAMFLVLALVMSSLVLASEITTDSYSVDSYHFGIATSGNSSTSSYGFRYTTTYEQGSNRDVATISYSANSGWLNNSLYINNDTLAAEASCDSNNLNLCLNEPSCTGAGGYWYNSVCNANAEVVCSSGNLNLCTNSDNCRNAGGYWHNGLCNTNAEEPSGDGDIATGRVVGSIDKTLRQRAAEELKIGDRIEIKISELDNYHVYELELVEITEEDVLIKIYFVDEIDDGNRSITGRAVHEKSEFLAFRLKVGEEEKIDLRDDEFYDLNVAIDEIRIKSAFLYIESIHEEIVKEVEKIEIREAEESKVGLMSKIPFVFIFIVVALVLVVLGFFSRGRFKAVYLKGRLEQLGRLRERRKISKEVYQKEKEGLVKSLLESIGPRGFAVVLAGLLAIVLLGFGAKMSGFTIAATTEFVSDNLLGIALFVVLVIAAALAVAHRKRIKESVKEIGKKHPKNSVRGLIKKKVYTEEGNYVGVVKDVVLHENKIYSLKISLGKKLKSKKKGIVVKYKNVHRTGHVVILDKKIAEHLGN